MTEWQETQKRLVEAQMNLLKAMVDANVLVDSDTFMYKDKEYHLYVDRSE